MCLFLAGREGGREAERACSGLPPGRGKPFTETLNSGGQDFLRFPSWSLYRLRLHQALQAQSSKCHSRQGPRLAEAPALTALSPGPSGCFLPFYLCFPSLFLPGLVCVRKPLSLFPVSLPFPPIAIPHCGTEGRCFSFSPHSRPWEWPVGAGQSGGRQVGWGCLGTTLRHQNSPVTPRHGCLLVNKGRKKLSIRRQPLANESSDTIQTEAKAGSQG